MRIPDRVTGLLPRAAAILALLASLAPAAALAQSADLSVVKSSPPTVVAGTDLTYTITVLNAGPDNADNVMLLDPLPAGTTFVSGTQDAGPPFVCSTPPVGAGGLVSCSIVSMPFGAPAQFTLTVHVPADTPDGTVGANTASVSSTTADPAPGNESSTANTTVAAQADATATLTAAPTATAGTDLSYTIVVANNGPSDAQNFGWLDAPPGTFPFVSLTQDTGPAFACGTPAVGVAGNVTCAIPALPAGASAQFTLVVHVPPDTADGFLVAGSMVVNTTTTDPAPGNIFTTAPTTIAASADVGVTKIAPPFVLAGTDLSYTITVSNAGPSDAQTASFSDPLPAGTTFVSGSQDSGPAFTCTTPAVGAGGSVDCSIATLPAGASAQFTLTVHVPSSVPDGTVGANAVFLGTATTDPNPGNNVAIANTTVVAVADLKVTKSIPPTIVAGGNLLYPMVVTNPGPSDAQSVTFTDPLPPGTTFASLNQAGSPAFACATPAVGAGGVVTCTVATLPAGATVSFALAANVPASTPAGTVIANTATVSGATAEANAADNSATATTTVLASADVSITKTGPVTANAGSDVTYTIAVANAGPSDAQAVGFSDPLPAGFTFVSGTQDTGPAFACTTPAVGATGTASCTIAALAAGASASFTLVANVPAATPSGPVINTASVTATTTDPSPANNSASATTTVAGQADVAITKSGPAAVTPGNDATYTITVANSGPAAATAVAFTDVLPGATTFVSGSQDSGPAFICTTPAVGAGGTVGCSIASLPAAASASFTLVIHVPPAATGTLANTASVTTASPDPVPGNDSATASAPVAASADVSITKTSAASVNAGSTLAYTVTVANAGPSDAQAVAFTDALPAGTTFASNAQGTGPAFACTTPAVGATGTVSCSAATLAAGASATFTLVVNVDAALVNGTVISNTATVSTTTTDPAAGNDSATAAATVSAGIKTYTAPSATGSGSITATFTGGGAACAFNVAQFIPVTGHPASPPAGTAPPGVSFPHGLFDFTTTGCTPGATLDFTITYPAPVTGDYWKYGPTSSQPAPHWYKLPATFAGNVVTFSITDGGLGDDDLSINGNVIDQGGPGVPGVTIPTLSEWMLAALALLLLATGVRRASRSRRRA